MSEDTNTQQVPQHIVIEAHQTRSGAWEYRVVAGPMGWHEAQAEWDRRSDTTYTGVRAGTYFMVRENADPEWAELPRPQVFTAEHNGRKCREAAAERAGRWAARGRFVGRQGGWIYHAVDGVPVGKAVCQGWGSFVAHATSRGLIRCISDLDRTPGERRWASTWVALPGFQAVAGR